MTSRDTVYFLARGLHGWSLDTTSDEDKSLEGIRAAIDRQNAHFIEHDDEPEQYMVYRIVTHTVFDDNDKLMIRSQFDNRIEIYPAEIVGKPYYKVIQDRSTIPNIMGSYDVVKAVRACENYPGSYVKRSDGEIVYRCSH